MDFQSYWKRVGSALRLKRIQVRACVMLRRSCSALIQAMDGNTRRLFSLLSRNLYAVAPQPLISGVVKK